MNSCILRKSLSLRLLIAEQSPLSPSLLILLQVNKKKILKLLSKCAGVALEAKNNMESHHTDTLHTNLRGVADGLTLR